MMRPATVLDSRGGWFGLDTSEGTPPTQGVRILHTRRDAWGDWTRFGSGTLPGSSRGTGPAVNVSPTGVYRLRCRPEPESLLVADAPLEYRATLLAFPGSSDLLWEPERSEAQDRNGVPVGAPTTVELDTTRFVYELSAADSFVTDTELSLPATLDIHEGDAMVVARGAGRGAVSVVESALPDGDRLIVTLSHPFGAQPSEGSEVLVGPWEFVTVEHRFGPVPAGDVRNWRGLALRATTDSSMGLMVYAISAWRPDINGFVFGTAGQGGKGYAVQIQDSFPGSLSAWAAESAPDLWIQGLAQQSSTPSSMSDYLDQLRIGLGDEAEIIWASDSVHAQSAHENWHQYIENNAEDAQVAAIFAVADERTGSFFEQVASGMRTDDAHYSSFGSLIIAEVWLEQLAQLADDPCEVADYNADDRINVFDLLSFQTDWEAEDPRADLDGDGRFLLFDFLVLLTAIDDCG